VSLDPARRAGFVAVLRDFWDAPSESRVQQHLVRLEVHELLRWVTQNPETLREVQG
jgi:hypothetical protein